jgi:hypothetical protein
MSISSSIDEQITQRIIRFCERRQLQLAKTQPQLIKTICQYRRLRNQHPWTQIRVKHPTIKISPDLLDEWTDGGDENENENEWMGWFAVHCTFSDWMAEVITPVMGREPCECWIEELFAFLPTWIVRRFMDPYIDV